MSTCEADRDFLKKEADHTPNTKKADRLLRFSAARGQ